MPPEQRAEYAERVAVLNDALRADLSNPQRGRVVLTDGIRAMIEDTDLSPFWFDTANVLRIVTDFADFTEDNNPHGERDFGAFEWKETRCFWKIDYYDNALEGGSPDPADNDVTMRIITILRADEY
ncbi:DUF3768 domain-containing protein [Novosphingobium sp. YJ-S2-02]|uniref:DUF3768 domain-containing protein n=2 Tax=Novosphingobium aureum TaxID=2792964 RepID=A0A931MN51_9SPHN|nr:DUF3768 domain-containing protein [Novosphingobium aureum]